MKKINHWFMNQLVVNKRDTRSTTDFIPLVNMHVPSKIRNLVGIEQTFGKQDDIPFLFFNCYCTGVYIL